MKLNGCENDVSRLHFLSLPSRECIIVFVVKNSLVLSVCIRMLQ